MKKILLILIVIAVSALECGCSEKDNSLIEKNEDQEIEESNDNLIMEESALEGIYYVFDADLGMYGLYNKEGKSYIVEPIYEYIGQFSEEGLAVAQKGDFLGYIDYNGNVVIDFYYSDAWEFQNGYAIVRTDQYYGMIDKEGNYVIQPQYNELSWINQEILQFQDSHTHEYGLCNLNGEILVQPDYKYFFPNVINGKEYIFAEGEKENCYFVLDSKGTPIFGEGTALESVQYIVDNPYGIYCAKCNGESSPNKFGFAYVNFSAAGGGTEWYCYLDQDFNILSEGPYDTANQFNSMGYAIVSFREDWFGHKTWGVLDQKGAYICDLPKVNLGSASNYYTESNGYFAIAKGYTGSYGMNPTTAQALVNIVTCEKIEYESIQFVDCTDYTIVQDKNSLLFGLYDKDVLVLECIYDSIELDGENKIILRRGAKEEIYK